MMSSVKKGEPIPGQCSGPFYSRYTEHKVVVNFQTTEESSSTGSTKPFLQQPLEKSPSHFRSGLEETHNAIFRLNSHESSTPSAKTSSKNQQSLSTGDSSDISLSSRHNSSEGSSSAFLTTTSDSRPVSPNSSSYDNPVPAFQCGSLDCNRSSFLQRAESSDLPDERRYPNIERNRPINHLKPKGTFASAIQKHSAVLLSASAFENAYQQVRTNNLTVSCPELITESNSLETSQRNLQTKTGSFGELNFVRKSSEHNRSSKNILKVPDIFTTSFTHSKVPASCSPKIPIDTSSAQHFSESSINPNTQSSLRRSVEHSEAYTGDVKVNRLLSPTMYRDQQVSQITDYLFIGSIESAYNERKLCRLEIESVVDISNMSEMQVPSHKKIQCPCLCQMEFKHFRSRLIIAVPDEENNNIDQYFEEINKFIEGARRCSKKVLIYSYEGKSRAALFAIQYLMTFEGLLLRQAYNLVKKHRPEITLNPSFQRTLEKLEKALYPDEKHSVNICNEYLNVADPQAIKCAWIDC